MCGIAGIWSNKKLENKLQLIKNMTDAIAHRGPDGEGAWISQDETVALGHRRLSILDLSVQANQPMHWKDKYSITFNGEIYNYIELREQLKLKGYQFKTESDTEVILACYEEWQEKCLLHLDGMFAFAMFDHVKKELFCARDRFGEKPFYYSFYNNCFVFASEMKALWAFGVPREANHKMLYLYLTEDLVENPLNQNETFYKNIYKLKGSHYFFYRGESQIQEQQYWRIDLNKSLEIDSKQISNHFLELLTKSVKRRLRSDVMVVSSLSGGLDSSSIVALVSELSNQNHTFSARFKNFKKDEGKYIDLVTNQFKTSHHNVDVNEKDLLADLNQLIWHQEEPFQTGSIYAQWCVYKAAKKNNILVMLDGQGADEYLCGYDKDFKFYLKEIYSDKVASKSFIDAIENNHQYKVKLSSKDQLSLQSHFIYHLLAKSNQKFGRKVPEGINKEFHQVNHFIESPFKEFSNLKQTLLHEMTNQGLEKLLKFADRNSMAHSVEVRLPFLFHELVEFVFSLKSSALLENGWSKAILRNSVETLLPNEIVRRKDKIGFEAPHQLWVKNAELNDLYQEGSKFLMKEKITTSAYTEKWKTIIVYRFLNL